MTQEGPVVRDLVWPIEELIAERSRLVAELEAARFNADRAIHRMERKWNKKIEACRQALYAFHSDHPEVLEALNSKKK